MYYCFPYITFLLLSSNLSKLQQPSSIWCGECEHYPPAKQTQHRDMIRNFCKINTDTSCSYFITIRINKRSFWPIIIHPESANPWVIQDCRSTRVLSVAYSGDFLPVSSDLATHSTKQINTLHAYAWPGYRKKPPNWACFVLRCPL